MLPEELIKKVRMIEITTRKAVNDLMSGGYRSHFKGHGVQFSEHRVYVPGDDIRHIDWKVSARSRDPLVKKYEEERELTVLLIVDISGSEEFGSESKFKSEVAAEIGGMLAYAANRTGDKIGVLLFDDVVRKIIPPKRGRQHVLRVIRDLLSIRASGRGTSLADALESADRLMKHKGVVFLISDFIAQGYEPQLRRLSRRHEVVAVTIADAREKKVPNIGSVLFADPETGEQRFVDTGSYAFRTWLEEFNKKWDGGTSATLKSARVEQLRILTSEDYGEAVVRFFRARTRKRR